VTTIFLCGFRIHGLDPSQNSLPMYLFFRVQYTGNRFTSTAASFEASNANFYIKKSFHLLACISYYFNHKIKYAAVLLEQSCINIDLLNRQRTKSANHCNDDKKMHGIPSIVLFP
jgi:hypothetical protein